MSKPINVVVLIKKKLGNLFLVQKIDVQKNFGPNFFFTKTTSITATTTLMGFDTIEINLVFTIFPSHSWYMMYSGLNSRTKVLYQLTMIFLTDFKGTPY